MSATNAEILGRDDANDLEAILAISNHDVDEVIHAVKDNADAIFTWDYEKGARPALNKLYEKAKNAQWNGETDPRGTSTSTSRRSSPTPRATPTPTRCSSPPSSRASRCTTGVRRSGTSWCWSPRTGP